MQKKPLLFAEIGQAHDGSFGAAKAYVDLAKQSGADIVKFQTHFAQFESSSFEQWRIKFSDQDLSRYDYWERMSFEKQLWYKLKNHAQDLGIGFVSSCFSVEAAQLLQELDVPFFKIASGEIANIPMINFIEKTNKPVVISTGLSSDDEIDRLLSIFGEARVTLLHCVSRYPTPAEKVNLNRLTSLKHKYPGCKIGLSDHSGTIFPSILALNFDIDLIELHIVFDRRAFGPDATSSLEPGEFLTVRNAIEFYSNMQDKLNSLKIDDDQAYRKTMLRTFGRSAFAKLDIEKDSVITEDKIIMKKPGIGLSYDYVMGKTKSASRFISAGELIKEADLK